MKFSRKNPVLWLALLAAALGIAAGMQWWLGRPLGTTTLPDGTGIVFERYTHGTFHEFGKRDARTVFKWLPARFWTLCRYRAPYRTTLSEADACTILWVRVRWQADRMEPMPSDLDVQTVENDGTTYSWNLVEILKPQPREFLLPYRADSLPMRGGRLEVRIVEKLDQRRSLAGHFPQYDARNAGLREAREQASASLHLPNPSRAKPVASAPLPLPQMQEQDGLSAKLSAIRVTPLADGEFTVEPQVELLWKGEKLPNAFRHSWSISTPGGSRTEPRSSMSVFIDHMREYRVQASQLPNPPMRGHSAWTLHLNVVATAAFPELAKEPGIPLFTAPVAARQRKGEPRPPEPTVSPEATAAGLGIVDVWPPNSLRLVVHKTPAPWFPAGWKSNEPLPFVVVAESDGKRVSLRSSSAGGGYGRYGLASVDFGTSQVAQELAYGKDWISVFEKTPVGERTAMPETVEYRLIPRRYWKFAFVVAPPEPPIRAAAGETQPHNSR